MRIRPLAGVVLAAAVWPAAISAHHGIINFDMNSEVDVSGVVAQLQFVNPHSWLHVDVTGPDGGVTRWKCELRGASVLRRSGWSPDMFAAGTRIRVTGAPDRFEPNTCYLGTAVFENGTRIDRYGQITRAVSIAAERPERRRRRPDGRPNLAGDWAAEQRVLTDPRGISGAFLPLSVAEDLAPGTVPDGSQPFPGTRGTAVAQADDPVNEFWNRRPSIRPLTPEGAKAMEGFDGASADNPRLRCEATSILFDWTFESDVNRIEQEDGRIVLRYGSMGLERVIDLNRRDHPAGVPNSRAGHSIGRWEGDVLVVETVGFAPGILSADGRLPHSERLHVTERFSLDDAGHTLTRTWSAEDPLYFEGAYTGADAVSLSDVPYQPTACEDLSFKTPSADPSADGAAGGGPSNRWLFWGPPLLVGAVLAGWALMRRVAGRA